MESFKPDYFSLRPVHFWSPEGRWHHLGVRTPCVTHGWAHAQHTRLGVWRQRRAKGRVTDIYVAGQRILCSECQKEHKRLKALLVAARTQDPNAPRVAELAAELKATPYLALTLHPKINTMYFERHPWLAMKLPAIITHHHPPRRCHNRGDGRDSSLRSHAAGLAEARDAVPRGPHAARGAHAARLLGVAACDEAAHGQRAACHPLRRSHLNHQ